MDHKHSDGFLMYFLWKHKSIEFSNQISYKSFISGQMLWFMVTEMLNEAFNSSKTNNVFVRGTKCLM